MTCQHCGAAIPENSNFCTYCGREVTPQNDLYFAPPPHPAYLPNPANSGYYLDIGKLFGDTFEFYKRHFGTMCLVGLILFGIPVTLGIICSIFETVAKHIRAEQGLVPLAFVFFGVCVFTQILAQLAQYYLMLGAIRQGLYLARGGTGFQADQMFPPLMMFLKVTAMWILVGCIMLGIVLVFLIPVGTMFLVSPDANVPIMMMFGLSLFAGGCAVIWLSVRLILAQVFIAEGAGIIDSLKYAWQATSGNFWMMLVAGIVLGICSLLGVFAFLIGIIITFAISELGLALAYLQLTGQRNCLDYHPVPHHPT